MIESRLWDFNIYSDKVISAHHPDIVVIYKLDNTVQLMDISIPTLCLMRIKNKEILKPKNWTWRKNMAQENLSALGTVSKKFT